MKRFLTYTLLGIGGFFALVGLASIAYLFRATAIPATAEAYLGEDCRACSRYDYLPLPEQAEADFPMALEYHDWGDYYAVRIFRAGPEWLAQLSTLYPAQEEREEAMETSAALARSMAGDAGCKRIKEFIRSRNWQHVHHTRLPHNGLDLDALRDEAGEYVMLYLLNR